MMILAVLFASGCGQEGETSERASEVPGGSPRGGPSKAAPEASENPKFKPVGPAEAQAIITKVCEHKHAMPKKVETGLSKDEEHALCLDAMREQRDELGDEAFFRIAVPCIMKKNDVLELLECLNDAETWAKR